MTPLPPSFPPTHLIIVCCHAIYLPSQPGGCTDEANWLIEQFQTGETETYIRHVEAGVRELARDPDNAILVFSGGATKPSRTERGEAEGYLVSFFSVVVEVSSLGSGFTQVEWSYVSCPQPNGVQGVGGMQQRQGDLDAHREGIACFSPKDQRGGNADLV